MKVAINSQNTKVVAVNRQGTTNVVSVGIQGPQGPQGQSGLTGAINISQAIDADTTNLVNGSILVYKTATQKWVSTTTLDAQNMDAGEF